jgi:uncharacterized protein (TIGR00730 family)
VHTLAREFGRTLARRKLVCVYGGCSRGPMGALADGALAEGGQVIGVLPRVLDSREPGHSGLTRLERVPDMQTRKKRLFELADAFVALPGGYGTLDELFEVLTDRVIDVHAKPVGLLGRAYYAPLLQFLDNAIGAGILAAREKERLHVLDDADELIDTLIATSAEPPVPPSRTPGS